MFYDRMPLYPTMGDPCEPSGRDGCYRLPLFASGGCRTPREGCYKSVQMENPNCPGECAEVLLGVDDCGNLTLCVRREPPRCRCEPPRSRKRRCGC